MENLRRIWHNREDGWRGGMKCDESRPPGIDAANFTAARYTTERR